MYFISVLGHGRGGHFHSLNHISKKLGEQNEVGIISIGPGRSKIIETNPFFLKHIKFYGLNFFKLKKEVKNVIRKFRPNLYHCFDTNSFNIIRLIISSKRHKLLINKCGGPNPIAFPLAHNLILFSQENMLWFENQKKFQQSRVFVIPNRVNSIELNNAFNPIERDENKFTFLRICRIGSGYNKSLLDAIELINKLLFENIKNIKLYIIGVVQDQNVFKELITHPLVQSGHVVFLTESIYTQEASKMLYLADAVIGTGRGIMESASKKIPLLTINSKGDIPVLLDQSTFPDAFKTNFSERNVFPNLNEERNFDKICQLVAKKGYYNEVSSFSRQVFEEYFSLEKAPEAYLQAYSRAILGRRNLVGDTMLICRSFYGFYKSFLQEKQHQ